MPLEGPPPIVAEEPLGRSPLFPTKRGSGLNLHTEIGTHLTGHDGLVHGGAAGALLVEQARQLGGARQPLWINSITISYPCAASLSGGMLETSGNREGARGFRVQLSQGKMLPAEAVGSYVLLNPYTLSHEIDMSYRKLLQVPVDTELRSKPDEILTWAQRNGRKTLVSYIKSAMPFYENLGVYESFYYNEGSDRTQIHLDLSPRHTLNRNGIPTVDEGLVVALIDSCSGAQVFTRAEGDQIPVTRENTIHFRSPIPAKGAIRVLSGVSEKNRTEFTIDTEVWHFPRPDSLPTLVAAATSNIGLISERLAKRAYRMAVATKMS